MERLITASVKHKEAAECHNPITFLAGSSAPKSPSQWTGHAGIDPGAEEGGRWEGAAGRVGVGETDGERRRGRGGGK